jgi:UDP-4-amino-4,6-dideoxy-N-acetyl-beta-L-altrosamine transaminase/dTDP-4-dehydrorhamnose reductase
MKKKILVIGASGLFGLNFINKNSSKFEIICNINKKKIVNKNFKNVKLNFGNKKIFFNQIKKIKPDIILNAAGFTDVKKCEEKKEMAKTANFLILNPLIKISNKFNIKLVQISTDHIFNGNKKGFYKENDKKIPINYYAKTKSEAEDNIIKTCKKYLIIRTNFFGWGSPYRTSFTDYVIKNLSLKNNIYLNDDIFFTPMYLGNLIDCLNILIIKNKNGIYNISSDKKISKYSFGKKIAKIFDLDDSLIIQNKKIEILKPKNMALDNSKISKTVPKKLLNLASNLTNLKTDFEKPYIRNFYEYLPYGKHYLFKKDIKSVNKVLKSNNLTQGPTIEEFEKQICKYVGAKYAIAVSSCSAGLHLACKVAGLNATNKLLTSPNTFVSSANAALHCNSNVEFADIESDTGNLSLPLIKKKLNIDKKIKAIMPVHFGGLPCDVKKIKSYLGKKKNIFIIEDAAHALGARYRDGSRVGSCKYSDMTVFSFHPVKSIACGEGGVITTNNPKIREQLKNLRSHGITKSEDLFISKENAYTSMQQINLWYYEMQNLGFHYRLTDIQASLGLSQLKSLDKFLFKRKNLSKTYDKNFSILKNVEILQKNKRDKSANHLYILLINFEKLKTTRTEFMQKLMYLGIGSQVHYIPVPYHPYYKNNFDIKLNNIKSSITYYKKALSIPLYYDLSKKDQKKIIKVLTKLLS